MPTLCETVLTIKTEQTAYGEILWYHMIINTDTDTFYLWHT